MDYGKIFMLALSAAFIFISIKEFIGYPMSSHNVLACSILAFAAAFVQSVETVVYLQTVGHKLFKKNIQNRAGINIKESLKNYDEWFESSQKRILLVGNMAWFTTVIIVLLFFMEFFQFNNNALSSALTFLSLALFFVNAVFKDYVEKNIGKRIKRMIREMFADGHRGKV